MAPSRLLDLGEDINRVRDFQDKTRNDRTATSTGSFPWETSPSTCSGIANFRRTSASYSDFVDLVDRNGLKPHIGEGIMSEARMACSPRDHRDYIVDIIDASKAAFSFVQDVE